MSIENENVPWIQEKKDAFFEGLRDLQERSGPNQNDQVTMLIHACIDEGINTGTWIIGTIVSLDFKRGHVGAVLNSGKGTRWARSTEGIYTNLH
jgi:hypothetical protein